MITEIIVRKFEEAIGKEYVITDADYRRAAENTNYHTSQHIPLVLQPGSVEELQACVVIANEHKLPVYPVSIGRNWGYGSRVPVQDDNILIELKRLNKISDYNEQLGYVSIEPGVTFQQLFDFLREQNSELLLSVTGGSPQSSVLGNALERGIGTGLYADRFATICNVEAVLGTGEKVASGFGRYGNTTAGHVYRWGAGPSIDGLFSQSNLGIVTQLTQWLMKTPDYFQLIAYKIDSNDKLPALTNKLQQLAMSGLVRPTITMYNDFRVLSSVVQYPFEACTPGVTHPDEVIEVVKKSSPFGTLASKWNGEISVRSVTKEHGALQAAIIEKELRPLVDELFVVEIDKAEMLQVLNDHYKGIITVKDKDMLRDFLLKKYIGIPDIAPIRQTYWRKRKPTPADMHPDRDACGLLWMSPIVPFTAEDIAKAVDIISNTIYKYPFEPAISLQCMSERAVNMIVSINWDREVEGEDEQARACYLEVSEVLKKHGYFPYRDTTMGMQHKQTDESYNDSYRQFLSDIKNAVDPNGIIAPGRYNII